jgi:hypothetical protein
MENGRRAKYDKHCIKSVLLPHHPLLKSLARKIAAAKHLR